MREGESGGITWLNFFVMFVSNSFTNTPDRLSISASVSKRDKVRIFFTMVIEYFIHWNKD